MAATITLPKPVEPTLDDDIIHIPCCDDNVALCGTDLTNHQWVIGSDDGTRCPLCAHIYAEDLPCPIPGCQP